MVVRILAWLAVIFGAVITLESVFIAHHPNWVWILIFILGVAYFTKNGFIKPKAPPVTPN
jgi:hypothetical protein